MSDCFLMRQSIMPETYCSQSVPRGGLGCCGKSDLPRSPTATSRAATSPKNAPFSSFSLELVWGIESFTSAALTGLEPIPVGNCARTLGARGRAAADLHNLIDLLPTQGASAFLSKSLMGTFSARITDAPVPARHHHTRGRTGLANATLTIPANPLLLEEL